MRCLFPNKQKAQSQGFLCWLKPLGTVFSAIPSYLSIFNLEVRIQAQGSLTAWKDYNVKRIILYVEVNSLIIFFTIHRAMNTFIPINEQEAG